jgi:hypothetical protein
MIRLIAPPLPAASRPSKMTTRRWPVGAHPLLHLDQLGLELGQLGLVQVVVEHEDEVDPHQAK